MWKENPRGRHFLANFRFASRRAAKVAMFFFQAKIFAETTRSKKLYPSPDFSKFDEKFAGVKIACLVSKGRPTPTPLHKLTDSLPYFKSKLCLKAMVKHLQCSSISDGDSSMAKKRNTLTSVSFLKKIKFNTVWNQFLCLTNLPELCCPFGNNFKICQMAVKCELNSFGIFKNFLRKSASSRRRRPTCLTQQNQTQKLGQ